MPYVFLKCWVEATGGEVPFQSIPPHVLFEAACWITVKYQGFNGCFGGIQPHHWARYTYEKLSIKIHERDPPKLQGWRWLHPSFSMRKSKNLWSDKNKAVQSQALCTPSSAPRTGSGEQLQTCKLSSRRCCSQQKLSSRPGQQMGWVTMLFGVSQVNLGYHVQTLNYRSKHLICHNYITSLIMGIATSPQDSCTSERKYALLLFPWNFFYSGFWFFVCLFFAFF